MKYDFTKVKYYSIDGTELTPDPKQQPPHKTLAIGIYNLAYKNLPLTIKAREIFEGKEVELDEKEAKAIKDLITANAQMIGLTAHAVNSIIEYINSVK